MKQGRILGVDVGSVALSVAELTEDGGVGQWRSVIHHGEVEQAFLRVMREFAPLSAARLAVTRSSPVRLKAERRVDNLVAAIRAAQHLHPGLGALMLVGGEKFSLSIFDSQGNYKDSRFNSLCAAGTGSFLDQQAERLGLENSAALAATALSVTADIPRIATRCAVFAKTDLIHAQQEGHGVEAICEGLCQGLAANVHDTLFTGQPVPEPIVFAGGVAQNGAVVRHMAKLLGRELLVDEYASIYGAFGAALDLALALEQGHEPAQPAEVVEPEALWSSRADQDKKTTYPPLRLERSNYPEVWSLTSYEHRPAHVKVPRPVEVDVYREPSSGSRLRVTLGIDIGSTSTKAVLLNEIADLKAVDADDALGVWAGFYTRTAGRPLLAVQALFETILDWAREREVELEIVAVGSTGSGRKFIGAIVGADSVLDEITAHARAAVAIDPEVDTIIEIGGQDAKFTTLADGTVTQSIMNHVCAAGTGSFIEEQAQRLDCALTDMADRTEGQRAPLASDRCTVFMERDINHFLSEGYEVNEVLCAVLHAVRENYLLKVARDGIIGKKVSFQGATAKNRSLVAAFEQKLERPISVSRYCHLTGALGVALELRDEAQAKGFVSKFRGLDLYAESIEVRGEVCDLCKNNCKLRVAEVGGETVAYGFLCGRDLEQEQFVSSNRSGFDLLRARKRHFRIEKKPIKRKVTIGLPAALHVLTDMSFWKTFFSELGVPVVTSEGLPDSVTEGKRLAGAEFCAPMSAWHAHVVSLQGKADFIFTPIYLEDEHERGTRRQHCYYTQYAPSLIHSMHIDGLVEKCLSPLLHIGERHFDGIGRLTEGLRPALGKELTLAEVRDAWQWAQAVREEDRGSWPEVMKEELEDYDDVAVVLMGRPYTLWSADMSKGIADILATLGVKTFEQDMVQVGELGELEELIKQVQWQHPKQILGVADTVARTPNLYPLLITSFKCGPDACTLEYFRRIMNTHGKPYLVLQLDEHDSQVGYETRIEAAVRAFRNHLAGARPSEDRRKLPLVPKYTSHLNDQTLLVPAWDSLGAPLFVAALQHQGIDARIIREDADLVQASLGHNTGQCIPLNIIVHEFMNSVKEMNLDPAKAALWMPRSNFSCNICFFPQYAKGLLETEGQGFEKCTVYAGETSAIEISMKASLEAYFSYLFAGMLRSMSCKVRPYEVTAGQTDAMVAQGLEIFTEAVLGKRGRLDATKEVVAGFLDIKVEGEARPKVALFGDLYARDNDVLNQDLVRVIEEHGAEALTTPYTEYARIIAKPYLRKWMREGLYKDVAIVAPLMLGVEVLERRFTKEFAKVIGSPKVTKKMPKAEELLARFGVRMHHTGESFDNLLKIFHLAARHPDLSLFVQTNPAFCCASIVTEAMSVEIEKVTGVPVVSVNYDGTASNKNDVIIPYLELACRRSAKAKKTARS